MIVESEHKDGLLTGSEVGERAGIARQWQPRPARRHDLLRTRLRQRCLQQLHRPERGDRQREWFRMVSTANVRKHIYSGPRNRSALRFLIIVRYTNTLTYLLT